MPRHQPLYEWTVQVATRFPGLPVAQSCGLAEQNYCTAIARAVQLTAGVLKLTALFSQTVNKIRPRVRELFRPGKQESGEHFRALESIGFNADVSGVHAGSGKGAGRVLSGD